MPVKIVTDSLSDITSEIAAELGITVVPLSVIFGRETFLDRVTITPDEFYRRLEHGTVWPTTTQPTPQAFAQVYDRLGEETDEILVITLSSKMSGTYESATGARSMTKKKLTIEVIDSRTVGTGLGMVVIPVAKAARKGAKLPDLIKLAHSAMQRSHFVAYFDTLKYLAKGGRIGKAQGLVGSLLSVKPILTVRDGEMAPLTRVRSTAAGMEYLYNFVASFQDIEELAIEHATDSEEVERLVGRIQPLIPDKRIYRSRISPVLGTYGGPGSMALTVLTPEEP